MLRCRDYSSQTNLERIQTQMARMARKREPTPERNGQSAPGIAFGRESRLRSVEAARPRGERGWYPKSLREGVRV